MKNMRPIISIAAAVIAATALAGSALWYAKELKRVSGLKTAQAKLIALREEMAPVNQRLSLLDAKRRNSRGDAIEAMDSVIESVGLKDKMKSLRLVSSNESGDSEERAELMMERVTLNETVNLLYAMDSSASPIITRKATLRTSFEKPTLLNISITLSYLKAQ